MKRSISLWQFVGFAVTSLGGTVLHYLYEWTGDAVWVAAFSGVNESTWEHMKLLFFPMFLYAIVQSRFFKDRENFWCVKLKGILLGLICIPVIFYLYNGAIGKSPDWFNIAIFFVAAAIAYIYETRIFKNESCKAPKLSFAALCVIALLFVIFTFMPLSIPLFQDPVTGQYGIG